MNKTDFCIIGGGIAGLSVAHHLSQRADVIVLEKEADLAYHTTGRSAALYSNIYVDGVSRVLTELSRSIFMDADTDFSRQSLHQKTGCIFTAAENDREFVEELVKAGSDREIVETDYMLKQVPILKPDEPSIQLGLLEKNAFKIDVAGLVETYRRQTLDNHGEIRRNAAVTSMQHTGQNWNVQLAGGEQIRAHKIINAAGAWGDVVAGLAGVQPMNLRPLRRTIITFDGLQEKDMSNWPAVGGLKGGYYFMPEAGKLLGSAADEVPSEPCDAQPEEYDIALAAHNIESHITLDIERIHHSWSGLRTFSPDRQPIAGYDNGNPNFFWLVGQGGFGIQTAPALSKLAAVLALEESLPTEFESAGLLASEVAPGRFS